MANIESRLFETAQQLEQLVSVSGKVVPKPGERSNIVENLDYIIELMGTMVTDETFKQAKKIQSQGYNGIADRIDTINYLLASGEISGDVDVEPIIITENGEYLPGAGKAFSRIEVETPEDTSPGIVERTLSTINNSTVTSIGDYAFFCYLSLTSVSFPACTSIGSSAFFSCRLLTTAFFPACTSIGTSAFMYCYSLTSFDSPACTNIGVNAFYSCYNLTTVSFPACTTIGNEAFANCSRLTTASFPACTSIRSGMFRNCSSLTTVSFPVCSIIGSNAFASCSSLMVVSFPACTSIGSSAFAKDSRLQSIYLYASSVCVLNNSNAFSGCASNYSVYVKASLYDQYLAAFNWSLISSCLVSI